MEFIIKVNAQAIENKQTKSKFIVYNTYIKSPDSGEWVKFNVKFGKDCQIIERTSYIYADEENISINEIGKYPTIYISKVNKQKVIEFDKKELAKFFRAVEEVNENDPAKELFGEPIDENDLPFDTDDNGGKD